MEEFIKFLKSLDFDEDDGQWNLENRGCAWEHMQESHGYNEVERMYKDYFFPISFEVRKKARELKVAIEVDHSVEYGELGITLV